MADDVLFEGGREVAPVGVQEDHHRRHLEGHRHGAGLHHQLGHHAVGGSAQVVDSKIGEGSIFTIRLPIAEDEADAVAAAS